MILSKSLWHIHKEQSAILSNPLVEQDNHLQIKSHYSLISTGTERLVARGQVPISLEQKMRVPFMKGFFTFPLKYGYSLVGEVMSEGNLKGQLVHVMHPHQDYLSVPAASVTVLPKAIPAKRGVLASNVETALNAIWDSQVSIGDKVLVVGFGMIGALTAKLLSLLPAVEVLVSEPNPSRQQRAVAMGFSIYEGAKGAVDYSFHTSGSAEGLQIGLDALGVEGALVELSWYGTKNSTIALGGDFHYDRKRIISSQVGQIPGYKTNRWNYTRRKEVVLELLKNPTFDEHLTDSIALEDSPVFFEQLRSGDLPDGLGWVIRY